MGTQLPSSKGHSLQFSAHICCGQMARWIKMSLGREVHPDPSDIVLHGTQLPLPQKNKQSPQFSAHVYCVQAAGWIKIPLGTKVGLDPGRIFITYGDPAPLPEGAQPPNFRPMSIVVIRSPISATAEHLLIMNQSISQSANE